MSAIKTSSVFVAGVLALFASSARAQGLITVNVPFPFVVGQQEFPAGRYDIRAAGQSGGSVISIEGVKNGAHAFALTNSAGGFDPVGDRPALVFRRYETEYRLSQIWESTRDGRELPAVSGAERTGHLDTQPEQLGVLAYVVEADRK